MVWMPYEIVAHLLDIAQMLFVLRKVIVRS